MENKNNNNNNNNNNDYKSKRFESRSRLPRMSSNQMNGQKGSTDTSSIPRPTNTQNQKIINKFIGNHERQELVNTSDNSKQSMNSLDINLLINLFINLLFI